MTEGFEHPVAVLNALEDPLEIVEFEFNEEEYFQVLDCPELQDNEQNEHQDGDEIRETTTSYLESRTNMELIDNHIIESEDSGSVVSDQTGIDVLTKIQESDASDEFKYKSVSSPSLLQPSSAAANLLRNAISKKKNGQSTTSSSLILGKTGSGRNLKKVLISSSPLEVPRFEAEDNEHQDGVAIPSSDAANIKHRLKNKNSQKEIGQSTSSRITLGKTGSGNWKKVSNSGSSLEVHGQENHIGVHTRERPFKCSSCKKTFIHLSSALRHKKSHTGLRQFRCSFCVKAFVYMCNLKEHERIHTGERPFKCRICEKAFAQSSTLQGHYNTHTGVRPFKCTICTKSFSRLSVLKDHYTTHTGERPYKCSSCTKTFVRVAHLKSHEIIHTGERKRFKCSYCAKAFSRLYDARKHERTHTGPGEGP